MRAKPQEADARLLAAREAPAATGAAREHIQFEETAVWPGLRTALNTERAVAASPW